MQQQLQQASDANSQANALGILGSRVFSDFAFAQAAGLARILTQVPAGAHSYSVRALNAGGQPIGAVLTTMAVDSATASPLPPPANNLRAQVAQPRGVALLWSPAPFDAKFPVIAYRVERDGAGTLTEPPLLLGSRWNEKAAQFVDVHAPEELELVYRVSSMDIFGRFSPPATIKATLPPSLVPPLEVKATVVPGMNQIIWSAAESVAVVGYLVERGMSNNGPFEALMDRSLPGTVLRYEDSNVDGGTTYYYRVRSISAAGNPGPPSITVFAQARNSTPPPPPADVHAELGADRVLVRWSAVPFRVAGYWIERNASGADHLWHRLNERPWPEPQYEDHQRGGYGGLNYRIVAIAYDNQESTPSAEVTVTVPDTTVPLPPIIMQTSGAGGKAAIDFMPSGNPGKSAQFLVVRSDRPDDPGLVIGDPLPGSARHYEDNFVSVGRHYYYRLYTLDAGGIRSEPTAMVTIRIGAGDIPVPSDPRVAFALHPTRAEISFAPAPAGLAILIQVKAEGATAWTTLGGPIETAEVESQSAGVSDASSKFVDLDPPTDTRASYRILYQAADGSRGPASKEVPLVTKP